MILVVPPPGRRHEAEMNYWIAGVIGLFGGLSSGLFVVGGGVVMVPAMVFFLKTDMKTAVGTSLVVIVPTAVMGVWKHHQLGNIAWSVAAALIPMAMAGGFLGAALTQPLHAETLKRIFGGFIVLVGLRLLFFK